MGDKWELAWLMNNALEKYNKRKEEKGKVLDKHDPCRGCIVKNTSCPDEFYELCERCFEYEKEKKEMKRWNQGAAVLDTCGTEQTTTGEITLDKMIAARREGRRQDGLVAKNKHPHEELVRQICEAGESLIKNAESIAGSEKYVSGLTIRVDFSKDFNPVIRVSKDFVPEKYLERVSE